MQPNKIADFGSFFVGGQYHRVDGTRFMADQMYVEYVIPESVTRPYPLVFIPGGGISGAYFTTTPDGRPGWAPYFTSHGYAVYICEQPARGRSALHSDVHGGTRRVSTDYVEARHTASAHMKQWPQAALHTQWPGEGTPGDPTFDQYFASLLPWLTDTAKMEELNRTAVAALLDRIGPAIVLTHSQSGAYGWAIADAQPNLVKGIVAIEPSGPPYYELDFIGAPDYFVERSQPDRRWGITNGPITYDPPLADAADLRLRRETVPDQPDLARCWVQPEPARKLPRLAGLPIVIVVGEASYHASYDHCTSKYLHQAGVPHEMMKLAELGIRGNGHMMMLEKNNLAIAGAIADWLDRNSL
jgi:pimeloyl-ACP methyl ester carboxylesterase